MCFFAWVCWKYGSTTVWYGLCSFDNLKRNQRFANILIFSGGVLFNALLAVAVVLMVEKHMIKPGMLTYQFTYFSMYYIFFALLPMPYPDGSFSDGKYILDLIRNLPVAEHIFRVQWHKEKEQWQVLDNKTVVETFQDEEEALARAHQLAQSNRPSRLLQTKQVKEVEVFNYPRVPL
jgi:hypothetical protein